TNLTAQCTLPGATPPPQLTSPPTALVPPVQVTPHSIIEPASHVPKQEDQEDTAALDGPPTIAEVKLAKCPVRNAPRDIYKLGDHIKQPQLPELTQRFLYDQQNPHAEVPGDEVDSTQLPPINSKVYIYSSACAVFYAPSDLSGLE
ncbi:hypothetical protein C0991_010550, partial [Blastosporella zonata]